MKTLIVALYPYQGKGLDSWHDHGAGMTYTASIRAGRKVDFLDMKTLYDDKDLIIRLRGYDLVAFGLKSSYYPLATKIIKAAKTIGAKVMVGGYHATAAPKDLLEDKSIDYIFHGESEVTFPKFLNNPSSFGREISGEKVENLDDLPIMDRDIFQSPIEDCSGWWYGGRRRMISIISSRD